MKLLDVKKQKLVPFMKKETGFNVLINIIFPLLLLIYPLLNFNHGVDLTDTGYNLGTYEFFPIWQDNWVLAYFLANGMGYILTRLPFGNTLMGMNLYTSLLISGLVLMVYSYFKKKMPPVLLFVGEMIAIGLCWCPTTILYNYLTYFLMTASIILLYQGVIKEKKVLLVLAGLILGVNVFTRFSNLTQMAFIMIVWYGGFLNKKSIKKILKDTALCLIGYLFGLLSMLGIIAFFYGIQSYLSMIQRLLRLSSSTEGYSMSDMIFDVFKDYAAQTEWIAVMAIGVIAGLVMFQIYKGKYEIIKKIIYVGGMCVILRYFYGHRMFWLDYTTYGAIFSWTVIFIMIAAVTSVMVILNKRKEKQDKLLATIVLIIIFISPLGSNNRSYLIINNMFLIAPITLSFLFQLLREKQFPIKAMITMIVALLFIQSVGFGCLFIFRDGSATEKRDAKIENHDILNGMFTTIGNAKSIVQITEYIEKNNLSDKKVILYGEIPGLAYYLNMIPAVSTAWVDLDSYSYETLQDDLSIIEVKPIVIFGNQEKFIDSQDSKKILLDKFIEAYELKNIFCNELFIVYE